MSDYDLIVKGHIVLAHTEIENGYVAIKAGKVSRVGSCAEGVPDALQTEDHSGCYVFPAAIDSQVHSRSQKGQEDFIWSTRAAASGGVGTIVDMPYDAGRLICNAERFNLKKQEAQEQARVDFALYGTVHPDEGAEKISEIVKAGAIGFKFSTFGTDPERFPRIPAYTMHDCFDEIQKYGLVAGVHNEDDEVVKHLSDKVKASGRTDYGAHTASRPVYSENLAVLQVYELGASTGCRAHVVHCSNGRGYEICASYQKQGYQSTMEACLHYMVLTEEDDVSKLVGRAKVNPPIRGRKEREALWQHLAAGNLTVVSTDHVSWSLDRKNSENMFENSSGATGLELLLPLMVTEAKRRGVAFSKIVQVLTYNVARLFSINDTKGALEVGKDADLAILKPEPYVYSASASGNNFSDWSPYDGRRVDFKVVKSMLRGQWVFDGKTVLAEPGSGKFIRPALLG